MTMLSHLFSTVLGLATSTGTASIAIDSNVHIRVDSSRQEVLIVD
jgi:hypothetical protein